jgi:hypothetical protein
LVLFFFFFFYLIAIEREDSRRPSLSHAETFGKETKQIPLMDFDLALSLSKNFFADK